MKTHIYNGLIEDIQAAGSSLLTDITGESDKSVMVDPITLEPVQSTNQAGPALPIGILILAALIFMKRN